MKHSVYEVVLPNGAQGLFVHIPDAMVMNFEINFRAGDYLVEKKKWETPHLMEHVLLGANKDYQKARLYQAEFEKNGAYCNASTGSYDITYEAECADFEWDRIVGLLTTAITKPMFLNEEFEAEYGNVREELSARGNNHFRHLSLALREAYGFCVLTDQARLKLMHNVSLEDVKKHYKHTHTASNMRFVIAGKLPLDRRKVIKNVLGSSDLPQGDGRIELPDEVPKTLGKPLFIKNKTVDNLYFYLDTFMSRILRDPEVDALSLADTMLTGSLYSRILGSAREKGLVYWINSSFTQTKDSTSWWLGAQVSPKNAPALFDIVVRELKALRAGKLDDDDVTAAKQYSLGRYQRSGQTVGGTAAGYSNRYFFDGEIDDYYKVPERIRAISKNRIMSIADEIFAEKVWGIGFLSGTSQSQINNLHKQISSLWK